MGAVKKIVLTVDFSSGHTGSKTFTLKEGQGIIIGRLTNTAELVPPNALKFASKVISRKHAQIFVIEDKICIRDTKSSSGTFVNGQRLSAQGEESDFIELCTQDQIIIGEDCFVDGVEYKAVAMDITIAREMVTQQASSGQTRPSVSASVSEEPLQSPNPGNATVKSKADVLGTPKASTFPTEMGEEDEITTFYAKPNEKTAKNTAKNAKAPEKEKPMMKSESVTSLRQVFDVDAKSKGSNPSLDQIGKRGKTSKEDLGKQKSKEDLGKMESEKSLSEKLEQQKQDAKKSDEEASEHNVIIPIGNIYINEVRELTAISEDNVAPLKSIHAKESMLSDLKNSHLKDLKDSPKSGSQFSFSDMPETLPGEFQSDLQIETDAIWGGILDGLDGTFMRYMFLTMPLSKATKDKGLLGDPEKQDLKRKSYSLAKVLSKNNMSSSKRESSMGSLGSMSHAPAKFSPIRSES